MDVRTMDEHIFSRIWTDRMVEKNLEYLTDGCNGRFAGSADERKAGDFLLEQLQAAGLENVHAEPFEMWGWSRGEATLTIHFDDGSKSIGCWEMACNPGGNARGEMVNIGNGTQAEIKKMSAELQGKIALTSTAGPHRSAKYAACQAAGAVGMIIYHHTPGCMKPAGSVRIGSETLQIPAIGISFEDGKYLLRKLKNGKVTASITTTSKNQRVQARNIVAEIPGIDPNAGWIVACAHYDGHDIAQAALDNATGTVLTMEVARILNRFKGTLKAGVRCIFFSGEELGLNGSHTYIRSHEAELNMIRMVFNSDIVGAKQPLLLMPQEGPPINGLLEQYAAEGIDLMVKEKGLSLHSDHFPFTQRGLPTLMATTSLPDLPAPWVHTAADTLDKIDPQILKQACAAAAQVILRMALHPEQLPTENFTEQQVQEFMNRYGLGPTIVESQG